MMEPRIMLFNLRHYDLRLKSWLRSNLAPQGGTAPWTQTEKAGAVAFWPVGGTPLMPTVDYIFTETGPAEGTKGPDNPSTITGVSSVKVTRCGKNLLPFPYFHSSQSFGSLDFTVNNDGSVTVDGENDTGSNATFRLSYSSAQMPLKKDVTYSISGCPQGGGLQTYKLYFGSTNPSGAFSAVSDVGSGAYATPDKDCEGSVYIQVMPGVSVSNLIFRPQVEVGSVATEFETPEKQEYNLSLGSTFYGGSMDLSTGTMTVTHVAVTPDASTMDISSAPAAIPLDYADTYGRTITSTDGTALSVGSTGGTVVYQLATPQTVQLDPVSISALAQTDKYTPRLNTIYSDQQAVQVGYIKSPIRDEFEKTQAVIAQGGGI